MRPLRGVRRPLLVAAALALAGTPRSGARDDAPLPYAMAIEVREGTHRAPAGLRSELQEALVFALGRDRCVREVRRAGAGGEPEGTLLLRVILDDVREETRWDMGIVSREQPVLGRDPSLESQVVIATDAQVELRLDPAAAPVRLRTFGARAARRPMAPGDDAVAAARVAIVDRVVREALRVVCGGSRRKLERDLARAAGETPAR